MQVMQPPQNVRPSILPGPEVRRVITLYNMPGNQWKNDSNHAQPYDIPDAQQNFISILLSFSIQSAIDNSWISYKLSLWYPPLKPKTANLWTIDQNGDPLETVFGLYDLTDPIINPCSLENSVRYPYYSVLFGTIHGKTFWQANVGNNVKTIFGAGPDRVITGNELVCGFGMSVTMNSATGTITLPPIMKGLFYGLVQTNNTDCGGSCAEVCANTCAESCFSACADDCFGTCTGDCTGGCDTTCTTTCASDCTGGCGTACASDCTGTCSDTCTATCGGDCTGSCGGDCTGSCTGGCESSCTAECAWTCTASCTGTCSGLCQGGCTGSCFGTCSTECAASSS